MNQSFTQLICIILYILKYAYLGMVRSKYQENELKK